MQYTVEVVTIHHNLADHTPKTRRLRKRRLMRWFSRQLFLFLPLSIGNEVPKVLLVAWSKGSMELSTGILLGIAAMAAWGTADFFVVKALKKQSIWKILLWSQLIGLAVFFLLLTFLNFPAITYRKVSFI